jgi:hypothetical protein
MKKTELYEIIKLKKPEPVHKTDEFLRGKGHDVLRLPPYHSNLCPLLRGIFRASEGLGGVH